MSKLFTIDINGKMTPRIDALIRIRDYHSEDTNAYRDAVLWEFHPDYDYRAKFRGQAYLQPEEWMVHDAYARRGVGWLKPEEVYVAVREFMVHEQDRQEIYRWCGQNHHKPLIIHPCPDPLPHFKRKERVRVVSVTDARFKEFYADPNSLIGELATCIEDSGGGGRTWIRFDRDALNRGGEYVSVNSEDLRHAVEEEK